MKRVCALVAILALIALVAAAQDEDVVRLRMKSDLEKMVAEAKLVGIDGAAMGAAVKGAPYSGVEVTESTQVLADGTRIHNEYQTRVFRDSEGRVRRETAEQVTIWDPTTNVSFFLDPKSQSAQKSIMRMFYVNSGKMATAGVAGAAGLTQTFEMRVKDGVTTATVNGQPVDPAELKRLEEHKAAAMSGAMVHMVPGEGMRQMVIKKLPPSQSESLGSRAIEGVTCEGTRAVTKIEAGAIGNDRPIEITNERWYSPELQAVVMTRRNDPRTGEEIFKLTNVMRVEPPADLFQVPPTYQLHERK
jgi:hypothetical protein